MRLKWLQDRHKKLSQIAIAAICLLGASAGGASHGTITFTGAITGNSCSIEVDGTGSSDGVVALPVVDTSALHGSPGARDAGGTFFNIRLGGCNSGNADVSGAAPTRVAIYFEAGPTVDQATHGLINSGTSNVEVRLYLASEGQVVGQQVTPGTPGAGQPVSQPVSDTITQYFYAAYSPPAGAAATAGTVSATVTYSVVYH